MTDKIHNAFDNIKADDQLKESTKQFLLSKRKNKTILANYILFQKKFAIACLILVFVTGIKGYLWIQSPVSYISIDVNPSIELALNCFDKVISVTAYNSEGEEILKSLSLKGKLYTTAIDEIVESQIMDTYITDESELIFTIAADKAKESSISTKVKRCCEHSGHNSQSISTDTSIVIQAHNHGLSLGKYYAYLQLIQYDNTVTIDDCRNMSMSELHELIAGYEHSSEHMHSDENSIDNSCTTSEHEHHHMH